MTVGWAIGPPVFADEDGTCDLTYGIGRLGGATIGGLPVAIRSSGMQLLGATTAVQQMVKGLVLLAAAAFDAWNRRRAAVTAQ